MRRAERCRDLANAARNSMSRFPQHQPVWCIPSRVKWCQRLSKTHRLENSAKTHCDAPAFSAPVHRRLGLSRAFESPLWVDCPCPTAERCLQNVQPPVQDDWLRLLRRRVHTPVSLEVTRRGGLVECIWRAKKELR